MLIVKQALFAVMHDGDRVIVTRDGETIINVPWDQAIEISKAIYAHAKQAEETASAEKIVHQNAALLRAGAPFSLTNNPILQKLSGNEAAWGWPRKYLRNKIRQRGVFAPSVYHAPKRDTDGG